MARTLEELQARYNSVPKDGAGMRRGPGGRHGNGGDGSKPKNTRNTIKRICSYLAPYKFHFFLVFVLMILSTATSLLASYFMKPIIDRISNTPHESDFADNLIAAVKEWTEPAFSAILPGRTGEAVFYLLSGIVILLFVYLVSVISTYAQSRIMIHISQHSLAAIRRDLFDHVQTLPLRFHDNTTTGELMSRFTNDVDNIGLMLDNSLTSIVSGIITLLGTLFFMFYTNVILSFVVILFVPLIIFFGMGIAKRSRKYFTGQQAALGSVNGYIEETVSGQKVIKVFNHEDECVEEFRTLNEDLRSRQFGAQFFGGVMGPVMNNLGKISYAFVAGIGGALVALTLGGQIATTSAISLTIGGLTIFIGYASQFSQPINTLSQQTSTVFSALAGAERVFAVMDAPSEEPDKADASAMPDMKGYVELHDVSFGYTPERRILHHISLYAKPGQKIAFVGSTGAGKTTVTNLFNRFYDVDEGSITIDGVDVRDIQRDVLRSNIAMVLQDTHLFTGTIRENIRYGRLDATDEEVVAAARTASAHSFIMRLEHGYDTMIEGDGANLSQGQRQLLNIARAALSKAPILVLDEATSSVDTRTERHIEHGMDRLMKNRTTFVIAHRLSTVRNADAIMVLEQGHIIERGNHDDLLALKGRYYELYTGKKELD